MREIAKGWILPEQDGQAVEMYRSVWMRANMNMESSRDDDSVSSDESLTSSKSSHSSAEHFSKYRGTPWRIGRESYPPGIIGLHHEIEDFHNYIKPTPEEQALRNGVVKRIGDLVMQLWPETVVDHFGSFKTGLYLPSSDIDLVILGKWTKIPLFSLEKHLLDSGIVEPNSLIVLDKASVPIIKLADAQTKIHVDISFNTTNGLKSVTLIQEYISTYPTLVKLVFVLKQFLLQRDLKDVFTGGISSYSLILMVVSFLQRHPREEVRSSQANLGVLLLEFFEHYGKYFNYYQHAIRVTNGGCLISKSKFMSHDPNYSPSILSIEDPLDSTKDIGKSSYGALTVKRAFYSAFCNLYRAIGPLKAIVDPNRSLLGRIILINDDFVDKRKQICRNHPITPVDPHNSVKREPDNSYSTIVKGDTPLSNSNMTKDDHSVSPKTDVISSPPTHHQLLSPVSLSADVAVTDPATQPPIKSYPNVGCSFQNSNSTVTVLPTTVPSTYFSNGSLPVSVSPMAPFPSPTPFPYYSAVPWPMYLVRTNPVGVTNTLNNVRNSNHKNGHINSHDQNIAFQLSKRYNRYTGRQPKYQPPPPTVNYFRQPPTPNTRPVNVSVVTTTTVDNNNRSCTSSSSSSDESFKGFHTHLPPPPPPPTHMGHFKKTKAA